MVLAEISTYSTTHFFANEVSQATDKFFTSSWNYKVCICAIILYAHKSFGEVNYRFERIKTERVCRMWLMRRLSFMT